MISQVAIEIAGGSLRGRADLVRLDPRLARVSALIALPQPALVTVGRALDCEICLPPDDDQISRRHFVLEITADSVRLRDCGSRNGTLVNDQPLPRPSGPETGASAPTDNATAVKLRHGDCILAGQTEFRIHINQQVPSPDPPTPAMSRPCGRRRRWNTGYHSRRSISVRQGGDVQHSPASAAKHPPPAAGPVHEAASLAHASSASGHDASQQALLPAGAPSPSGCWSVSYPGTVADQFTGAHLAVATPAYCHAPLPQPNLWPTPRLMLSNRFGPPQIEGFAIQRCLGRNSLGASFLCRALSDNRLAAIKVVRSSGNQDDWFCNMLEAELGSILALRHENLVGVEEHRLTRFGDQGWGLCLATAYCPEGNASQLAAKHGGRLPPHKVHDMLSDCLEGLAFLHARGRVHGNLKPSNVLFTSHDGRLRARLADGVWPVRLPLTLAAHGVVTAHEPTPDGQFQSGCAGDPVLCSPTADVWCLGAIARALLTGRRWQVDSSGEAVSGGATHAASGWPHYHVVPRTLEGLFEVIDRALSTAPESRFPDAVAMWAAFQRVPRPPAIRVDVA